MHLSHLTSIGLVSILFNALPSHGHTQLLRGGRLSIPEPPSPEKLVGTNWQLKGIGGTPALPEDPQRLLFHTETELSGYDGCNGFSATWETILENDSGSKPIRARPKISIEIGMMNRRGCSWMTEEQVMQQRNFMTALRQEAIAFSLSADEQELTLYQAIDGSPDVPIVMTRIPIPPQPHERLIGTSWVATDIAYSNSDSELTPVLEDHPVTMSFDGKGDTFFGSTGTNKYTGDITMRMFNDVSASMEFQVTNVGQTNWDIGAQDDNDPRLLQEHAWMDIIAADDEVVTIPYTLFDERIGDTDEWTQVLLLGSFQAPLARFVPLPEGKTLDVWGELQPIKQNESEPLGEPINPDDITELAGSNWLATNIRGTRISHDVSLFFASDTSLQGHGGCNAFVGRWDMLFGIDFLPQFRVGDLVTSYMYCEGKVGETEIDFLNGLQRGPIIYETSSGGELTLWDTVVGDDGRQTRGDLIAKFQIGRVPNWGGQSLVGMTGEEAKAVIEAINPSLEAYIVPEGSVVTADLRLNRVRIWVDKNGNVAREPQRG